MKYFTFVLNEDEFKKIKDLYNDYKTESSNEHIDFQAYKNEIEIIGYTSKKLLLRGEILKYEVSIIKNYLGRKDYAAIGSDEVGTGDVFGPVTVCAAYVSLEDIEFLEDLNIRDSKSVNDRYVIENAPKIAKRLTHSLIILDPHKYNSLIDEGYNLNRIKAHLHNQAIISLTDKLNNDNSIPIIVDQFCQPQLYFNYLKDELLVNKDVQFYTKAETVHIAVAAAAIIARYAFLYKMQQYSKKLNVKLLKGASKAVDEQIDQIYMKHGASLILKLAKKNFKNITRLNIK
ncbi:ribonuclease HIII [Haploplasma modicum]|jgi:ribonuclease HIII|uniref:ribonuclease HIII n=1 Tax=Haploplasma modicum TaxID=2150 RepID=UPI00047D91A6|nr:ribonuclease HIII [Haploplasma modicum]MCR1808839.1 ribonuclease HIII [Haploplasma modicum]